MTPTNFPKKNVVVEVVVEVAAASHRPSKVYYKTINDHKVKRKFRHHKVEFRVFLLFLFRVLGK